MADTDHSTYLRPAFVAGLVAAMASVATAAVVVFIAGTGGAGSTSEVLRTAARTWLIAIGSGFSDGDTHVTVVPVGTWLIAIAIIVAAVRWALPDPVEEMAAFVAATGGVVGLAAGMIALADSADIGVIRAAVAGFIVGAAGSAIGAVTKHGGGSALWFTVSEDLRRAFKDSLVAVACVLAVSTLVVVAMLLRHRDRAADLWALLDPGLGGGLILGLACILAVPTAVLWTAAVLIGPGFAFGADTSVDLTGSHLGAVPGFPLLAALPSPGEFSGWVWVLGLTPLIAGAVAGFRADTAGKRGLVPNVVAGAATGAMAGFLLGVMVGASGGSVGPGRMADVGPPALTPLLVGCLVMGLGGAMGGAMAHYREARAEQRSEP